MGGLVLTQQRNHAFHIVLHRLVGRNQVRIVVGEQRLFLREHAGAVEGEKERAAADERLVILAVELGFHNARAQFA